MELHGAVNGRPKARERGGGGGGDVCNTWAGQNEQELGRGSRKQSRAVTDKATTDQQHMERQAGAGESVSTDSC